MGACGVHSVFVLPPWCIYASTLLLLRLRRPRFAPDHLGPLPKLDALEGLQVRRVHASCAAVTAEPEGQRCISEGAGSSTRDLGQAAATGRPTPATRLRPALPARRSAVQVAPAWQPAWPELVNDASGPPAGAAEGGGALPVRESTCRPLTMYSQDNHGTAKQPSQATKAPHTTPPTYM